MKNNIIAREIIFVFCFILIVIAEIFGLISYNVIKEYQIKNIKQEQKELDVIIENEIKNRIHIKYHDVTQKNLNLIIQEYTLSNKVISNKLVDLIKEKTPSIYNDSILRHVLLDYFATYFDRKLKGFKNLDVHVNAYFPEFFKIDNADAELIKHYRELNDHKVELEDQMIEDKELKNTRKINIFLIFTLMFVIRYIYYILIWAFKNLD